MDHREVGRFWDSNAEVWTKLSRAGYDAYRDHLNTPAFLALLPDVHGLRGLDIGCGEGHNTSLVVRCGAHMIGVDVAKSFLRYAHDSHSATIAFGAASAVELPFPDATFDFATAMMSLMDIPETGRVVDEAYRVLRPGGFLQFSITHPCSDTPHRRNLRGDDGQTYAIEIGGYFERLEGRIDEWLFSAAPDHAKRGLRKFRIPRFHRPLSEWLNLTVDAGFAIERVQEPTADDDTVAARPELQDTQIAPYFLHIRCRK